MMTRIARNPERCPTHPGALLRDIVFPALKRPKAQLSRDLTISRQTLYDILAEKQLVTPQMAVRLGKLLGNSPETWLNMQAAYDLWQARRDTDTSRIPALHQVE
jgi:addiction module HigA family antidote